MDIIKKCELDDILILQKISQETFRETFAVFNTEENIREYIEKSFNYDKLRSELLNTSSSFYLLFLDGNIAGYIKLNDYVAQTDINDPQSVEIERIYVLNEFQGKGLGHTLMNKAIEIAKQRGKSYIWLGVWEKNSKAIRFYKNNGFYENGKHLFALGEDKQTDYIMKKEL